jgi:transcriptional regulator with XRE-family HTH domain
MRLHVHEMTVSRWECGKSWPTLRQQVALCEALNVSVEELGLSAAPPRVISRAQAKSQLLLPRGYADDEYVEALREHTRQITELENRVGGAELSRVAVRFFGSVQ